MSDLLSPLLTDKDQIRASLRLRKKPVVVESVKVKNSELLDEAIQLKVKDGWKFDSKGKLTGKVSRPKPLDEQLEDEIWCFLAEMQFDELSEGRCFKIRTSPNLEPRQIDVFAKDQEVAVFVECTQREEPGKKPMASLIEKIKSFREDVHKALLCHYGREAKLKQAWVIATRNIDWSPADLEKAKEARICVIRETEIDYYKKFTKLYKIAAKYQLLSHLFSGEKIQGLDLAVPATKGFMNGVSFYNFLIKPSDLLKISHVSHKASREVQDIDTYQRMLQPKRLKEIANYIDNGGQFPTNIVINIRAARPLNFEQKDSVGDSSFGVVHLPKKYGCAMVIDGQHRLYGYAHSRRMIEGVESRSTVPVLAYENLPPTEEAKLFVDINCEQVRVPRNLLNEINATIYWDSPDFNLQVDALCSRVVMALNNKPGSPVYDRVQMTNRDKTKVRCLTLTNFIDGLKENRFFGEMKASSISPGPFSYSRSTDKQKTMNKAVDILDGYLGFFAQELFHHWQLGNDKDKGRVIGYLATNEGIRALLRALKAILTHIQQSTGLDLDILDSDDLLPKIKTLAKPIADIFKTASFETIAQFRSRSGQKGVKLNTMFLLSLIHKQFNEFNPLGLQEFMESMDEEGTAEAKIMIGELQRRMHKFVLYKLKEHYPNGDEWWYEGVPTQVRKRCMERREEEKGANDPEQYLTTIDYQNIAGANWRGCFEDPFTLFSKDGGKEKKLEWIKELSRIRNITHHEEKWPATKKDIEFVREVHRKVFERFIIPEFEAVC